MDGSDWEEEIWPQSLKKLRCLQFAKDESHVILEFILVLKCRRKQNLPVVHAIFTRCIKSFMVHLVIKSHLI